MSYFNFLNKKFTLLDKKSDRYILIGIVLIFSILFINLFVPWNISRWYSDSGFIQFLRLSSYGIVVALIFLFTQFPLRKIFRIQYFKIKNYLLWLLLEIILISLVYIFIYGNPIGNFFNDLIYSLKYTLLGICLPYSFAILIIYYKNQRTEIQNLKNKISKPLPKGKHLISFNDDGGKIKFSIQLMDVLVLESADNYVMVFYLSEENIKRKLLRNTLKNLENNLAESHIVRCHRSFMVNLQNIELVKKEGKKLQLKIKKMKKNIPVSQKYSPRVLELLP